MSEKLLAEVTLKGLRAKGKTARAAYLAAAQLIAIALEAQEDPASQLQFWLPKAAYQGAALSKEEHDE